MEPRVSITVCDTHSTYSVDTFTILLVLNRLRLLIVFTNLIHFITLIHALLQKSPI